VLEQTKIGSYARSLGKNDFKSGGYDSKQKRCFHRAISGLKKLTLEGKRVVFITLTTAKNVNEKGIKNSLTVNDRKRLNNDVSIFIKRLKRKNGNRAYFKVITNELYGVVHILYAGYIRKEWIRYNWKDIHGGSYIIYVTVMKNQLGLAHYMVQYLSEQKCSYTRIGYSANWLFPGAVKKWKEVLASCRYWNAENPARFNPMLQCWTYPIDIKKAVKKWNELISDLVNNVKKTVLMQTYLNTDYG